MGAQLQSVEVYYSYADERLHIHLPATLSPIIGKSGRLRCRLEGVRRPNDPETRACNDEFDSEFGNDRRLIIPSDLANRRGVVGGAALTVTIEAKLVEERGFFRRRHLVESVFPNDTVQFDAAEVTSYRYAAPSYGPGPMVGSERQDLSFLPPGTRGLGAPGQGQPGFQQESAEQPTLVLSPAVATMIPQEDADNTKLPKH